MLLVSFGEWLKMGLVALGIVLVHGDMQRRGENVYKCFTNRSGLGEEIKWRKTKIFAGFFFCV